MMNRDALRQVIRDNPEKTDAEIAAIAQADKRTSVSIPLDLLTPYLVKEGLPFAFDMASKNEALPLQLRAALSSFNVYLSGANRNLDTSDLQLALIIYQVMAGAVAVGVLSQVQADAIVAMGGGYQLADVTEADVATARAAIVRSDAIAAIRNLVSAAAATFLNERVNPAVSDSNIPIPSWDDFKASL